jgi:hypothetical protein
MELAPKVFEIFKRLEKEYEEKFGKEPEPQILFSGAEIRDMIEKGDWPEAWGGPDELKRQRDEEEKKMLEDLKKYREELE